jgi:hypothetical protein
MGFSRVTMQIADKIMMAPKIYKEKILESQPEEKL